MGNKSNTSSETNTSQTTNTKSLGLQDIDGIGIASEGDVSLQIETTDLGAVQGAFEFADAAFNFANDAGGKAAELAESSIETSQQAVATIATGGQSDLSRIDSKTITMALAAITAIFVLPKLFKGAA